MKSSNADLVSNIGTLGAPQELAEGLHLIRAPRPRALSRVPRARGGCRLLLVTRGAATQHPGQASGPQTKVGSVSGRAGSAASQMHR